MSVTTTTSALKSKPLFLGTLSFAVLAALLAQPVRAYNLEPIEQALKMGEPDAKYGQFKVNLRYRYELHDTDNSKETGHANTLRLRLGYLTPKFYGFQSFVEYEGNLAMQQDYNAGKGAWKGDTTRDVVADPQENELNQFWLSYKGIPDTEIKAGRQRIVLDDARFIGNVGWRQMEQTYDAVMLTNKSIENMTVKAGYIGQVQDIFSNDIRIEAPFVNVTYKATPYAQVTGYGYMLYYPEAKASSSKTFGFSVKGSPKINQDFKLHYTAEYSHQSEYLNDANPFSVNRYNIMAGASFKALTFKVGVEELGGDGTNSFKTPLGTNHKFQGWADRFLGTPGNGVRDVQASVMGKAMGAKMLFAYHNLHSAIANQSYGNEYDFLVTKKIGKHYSVLAKYAYFDADNTFANGSDTHKFWLQAAVNF